VITVGKLDGTVKIWRSKAFAPGMTVEEEEADNTLDLAGAVGEDAMGDDDELAMDEHRRDAKGLNIEPAMVYTTKTGFNGIDHHRTDNIIATASNVVQVWDETRSAPISTLQFGSSLETVSAVRFNQSETSVLASIGNDRTMCLYDIRTGKAERRIVMNMRSNSLSWCPTLPTVFLLASEDHNLYTFDLRNLETPTQIYKGHVGGVMGCDWSEYRNIAELQCRIAMQNTKRKIQKRQMVGTLGGLLGPEFIPFCHSALHFLRLDVSWHLEAGVIGLARGSWLIACA
jgi:WD repeat and SOF domain-containing protein 1